MKSILTLLTVVILFNLSFTLSSCKKCKDEPAGGSDITENPIPIPNPSINSTALKDAVNSANAAAEEAVKAAAEVEGEKLQLDAAIRPLPQALKAWTDHMAYAETLYEEPGDREVAEEEVDRRRDTINNHIKVMIQRMVNLDAAARRSQVAAKKAQSIMMEMKNGCDGGGYCTSKEGGDRGGSKVCNESRSRV
jgi:flagellar motility protein MotE (MotC chaperone)